MKWFLKMMLPALVLVSCSKEAGTPRESVPFSTSSEESVSHEEIVLGKKLDNPYSLHNVKEALAAVYPTRAGGMDLAPTDLYVRFLPGNEEELNVLNGLGIDLLDHPVDYEILQDGDYYHDPSVPEDRMTWQYAVVKPDFVFPEGIEYEVLDQCCIPDADGSTRGMEDIDWEMVEREAYRLSGNESLLVPETRGHRSKPSGRITIVDKDLKSGRTRGVSGVKVVTNVFVRIASDYTDKDGNYEISKKYAAKPHYRLVFKNSSGFSIGLNLILLPASMSNLGKGSPGGKDVQVDENSDGTLFRRCVVNNAAYDYIARCRELGISAPPGNLRIWIFKFMRSSSAVMIHHGAALANETVSRFLGMYKILVRIFAPDITIGAKGRSSYASLYASTVHEMAHASHFQQVGPVYWGKFERYVLESCLGAGNTYGSGCGEHAGYCEVGEMWAYYMENKLYKERYGFSPDAGYGLWFYPQIFMELEKGGMAPSEIFKALRSTVVDRDSLRERLKEICPGKKDLINRLFKTYSR